MNKEETIKIITLLAGNYTNIADKTKEQKQLMVNTWYECLNDLDYQLVLASVKKCIIESPYPPTIHEIRKNAVVINKDTPDVTPIEAWQEAYKMICNGTYMSQEEFEKHSPEVKKFFGSLENLRSYSSNEEFNVDVVRSNFIKQYEIITKRQNELQLLPQSLTDTNLYLGE